MKISRLAAMLMAVPGVILADVKMPAIFGDHMVLQQDMMLPVWGWADPGEKVTVTVGQESAGAIADAAGRWIVRFPAIPANAHPLKMTVVGKNTLTFNDVLMGEVWLCSGQSNMAFPVPKESARDAADPGMRFFVVAKRTDIHPDYDVAGKWVVCTPETTGGFSAAGYFFGRELRAALKHPVGLIGSYWSGSGAHSWVSIDGFRRVPSLRFYAAAWDQALTDFPEKTAAYPALEAAYQRALGEWEQTSGPAWRDARQKFFDAVNAASARGLPAPERPVTMPPDAPPPPVTPDGGPHTPSGMFNGMIAPLIPYGIKGVIWYQGESNHARGREYRELLTALITDWRSHWGEGDFPFLIVQLPNFTAHGQDWTFTRESQLKVSQSVPATGIAVAIDVGDPNNLHPVNKLHVGLRLAQAAKHIAYGQDVVFAGPVIASEKIEGNAIRVRFINTGGGLAIGTAPYYPAGVASLSTWALAGFTIAGDDRKWVAANARIDGDSVVISSPQIPAPVAVRYAWENSPRCNLYNKEGFPASPFRTDDWQPESRVEDWTPWKITSPVPAYAKNLMPTPSSSPVNSRK